MNSKIIHYLAYGSNLHPVRLSERVPSAILLGKVELPGYTLSFRKRSHDGSGKCDLIRTNRQGDRIYGALFRIEYAEKTLLDGFEGLGKGYMNETVSVSFGEEKYNCLTYLAQTGHIDDTLKPFHWYKQLVVLGARYLDFPEDYLSFLESHDALPDKNISRQEEHAALIERIKSFD